MWRYKIDKKRRVTIPREFRNELGKEIIIALCNGLIRVYSLAEKQKLAHPFMWIVGLDRQGRILIPKQLKIKTQKVVWHGEGNYLELRAA